MVSLKSLKGGREVEEAQSRGGEDKERRAVFRGTSGLLRISGVPRFAAAILQSRATENDESRQSANDPAFRYS